MVILCPSIYLEDLPSLLFFFSTPLNCSAVFFHLFSVQLVQKFVKYYFIQTLVICVFTEHGLLQSIPKLPVSKAKLLQVPNTTVLLSDITDIEQPKPRLGVGTVATSVA